MVREVRFAWDETEGHQPVCLQDRRESLDDESLDHLPQDASGGPQAAGRKGPGRPRRSGDTRRHLAGADWISEEFFPGKRRLDRDQSKS